MIESYIIFLYKYGCCDHEYLPISWSHINSKDHTNPKLFFYSWKSYQYSNYLKGSTLFVD